MREEQFYPGIAMDWKTTIDSACRKRQCGFGSQNFRATIKHNDDDSDVCNFWRDQGHDRSSEQL